MTLSFQLISFMIYVLDSCLWVLYCTCFLSFISDISFSKFRFWSIFHFPLWSLCHQFSLSSQLMPRPLSSDTRCLCPGVCHFLFVSDPVFPEIIIPFKYLWGHLKLFSFCRYFRIVNILSRLKVWLGHFRCWNINTHSKLKH